LALALAYALCVACSYSYSSPPGITAPRNECSREHSLPGTKVPGNFRPVGTFAPRSENTGERKVPEPNKLYHHHHHHHHHQFIKNVSDARGYIIRTSQMRHTNRESKAEYGRWCSASMPVK